MAGNSPWLDNDSYLVAPRKHGRCLLFRVPMAIGMATKPQGYG